MPGVSAVTDITADSQIKDGSTFAIKCSLKTSDWSPRHFNASNIVFHLNDEAVHASRVRIVDQNSAEVVLDPAKVSDSGFYYCYVSTPTGVTSLVCSMHLEVGLPPSNIGQENMSCVSNEYENLTCTWQTPDLHTKTRWTLREVLVQNQAADCPIILSENSCRWTTHSHPAYRKHVSRIKLALTAENHYGNWTEAFLIDHFAIIRPSVPGDVSIVDVTSTSVQLAWKLQHGFDFGNSHEDDSAVPKLVYQVQVLRLPSSPYEKPWNLTTYDLSINVSSLTPFTAYSFTVRCKTVEAKGEHMWSDDVRLSISTKPDGKIFDSWRAHVHRRT